MLRQFAYVNICIVAVRSAIDNTERCGAEIGLRSGTHFYKWNDTAVTKSTMLIFVCLYSQENP